MKNPTGLPGADVDADAKARRASATALNVDSQLSRLSSQFPPEDVSLSPPSVVFSCALRAKTFQEWHLLGHEVIRDESHQYHEIPASVIKCSASFISSSQLFSSPSTAPENGIQSQIRENSTNFVGVRCASNVKRGHGWGIPDCLGLRGGADNMTKGATGWGTLPVSSGVIGGTSGEWGTTRTPNSSGSVAWGTPNASLEESSNNVGGAQGTPSSSTSVLQSCQSSTSWAAAVGKGLTSTQVNHSSETFSENATTSKHLEQLNMMREALFSQDGWNGCNVKQDTSWDFESHSSVQETSEESKESNVFVGINGNHRNDGTNVWKATLAKNLADSKLPLANPVGGAPRNPAEDKNWREDNNHASNNSWQFNQPSSQFNKSQSNGFRGEDRGNGATAAPEQTCNWNESTRDVPPNNGLISSNLKGGNCDGSWGEPSSQRQNNPGHWSNAPERWQRDSPTTVRKPPTQIEDAPVGTSHWDGTLNYQRRPNPSNESKCQDLPRRHLGAQSPPGWMMTNEGGGGMNDPKDPWVQTTAHSRSNAWGEERMMAKGSGWGNQEAIKRESGNWSGDSQWNKPHSNVMQQTTIYSNPSRWDDASSESSFDVSSCRNQKNCLSKSQEVIWNSKQFRILCDMGFHRDTVESTLRVTNLCFEDALEMLNSSRHRFTNSSMGPSYGAETAECSMDGLRASFPVLPNGSGGNSGANFGNISANIVPFQQSHEPTLQQLSKQQSQILVREVQLAIQTGHLYPQILNEPLGPHTLTLINHILQQIKHLRLLQQQYSISIRENTDSQFIVNFTVSIAKTKQQIQNLENQILTEQAAFLKSIPQSEPEMRSTVQEMFSGLSLMGEDGPMTSNGSRLAQWKLTEDFPKDSGAGSAKSTAMASLDYPPWAKSADAIEGWGKSIIDTSNSDLYIPEFEPGKPWKGPDLQNPEEDPNLTPGSVTVVPIGLPSKSGSSITLSASSWNFGNVKSEMSNHSGASNWLGRGSNQSNNSVSAAGSSLTEIGQGLWGGKHYLGQSPSDIPNSNNSPWLRSNNELTSRKNPRNYCSAWLLLKNLTPQIDGSTLKTLCMQHGPLQHFDLYLNHSIALVMYASSREAANAQKALNNCLLGNTTIHANITSESDISTILQQLGVCTSQQPGGGNGTPFRGSTPSNLVMDNSSGARNMLVSSASSNVPPVSSLLFASESVWGAPDASSSLESFLPGDVVDSL